MYKTVLIAMLFMLSACTGVTQMEELKITSPAFQHTHFIPAKYTCQGDNINPPLKIQGTPQATKSLVLTVDDPDAPRGTWDHWIVFNIPPTNKIYENSTPGTEGLNSFRQHKYGGPCPPSGTHRYFFKVYALDTKLDLREDVEKTEVLASINGHILAKGELMGRYQKG